MRIHRALSHRCFFAGAALAALVTACSHEAKVTEDEDDGAGASSSGTSMTTTTNMTTTGGSGGAGGSGGSGGGGAGGTGGGCETQRFYLDADGDGFGDPADFIDECDPVGQYDVTNGDDCCDGDLDAFPGQMDWFPDMTSCGDYDYNCDSADTLEVPICGNPGTCTSFWTICPVPACGDDSDLLHMTPQGGGVCSSYNVFTAQRCH